MKLTQDFFIKKINEYKNSKEYKRCNSVKKQIYVSSYVYLLLLTMCSFLKYNFDYTNLFMFLNKVYTEIIIALKDHKNFEIEFLPDKNDIIFNFDEN